jgi:hypothetical protein
VIKTRNAQTHAWLTGAGPLEKARVIGYLAGIARRAIETGTMAQRLEVLESVLKNRKGKERS